MWTVQGLDQSPPLGPPNSKSSMYASIINRHFTVYVPGSGYSCEGWSLEARDAPALSPQLTKRTVCQPPVLGYVTANKVGV